MVARYRAAQQHKADKAAENDGGKLPPGRRQRQHHDGRHDGERGALAIGRQRAHHRQHGLRHYRHGGDHQPMQPAAVQRIAERGDAIAEQNQRDRRRQREAAPRRERTGIAGARQPDGDADLAARRSGQELRQRHEVDIGLFVEPTPAHHEFLVEIAEMRDRAAEAGESEPEKHGEDFRGAAAPRARVGRRVGSASHGAKLLGRGAENKAPVRGGRLIRRLSQGGLLRAEPIGSNDELGCSAAHRRLLA